MAAVEAANGRQNGRQGVDRIGVRHLPMPSASSMHSFIDL